MASNQLMQGRGKFKIIENDLTLPTVTNEYGREVFAAKVGGISGVVQESAEISFTIEEDMEDIKSNSRTDSAVIARIKNGATITFNATVRSITKQIRQILNRMTVEEFAAVTVTDQAIAFTAANVAVPLSNALAAAVGFDDFVIKKDGVVLPLKTGGIMNYILDKSAATVKLTTAGYSDTAVYTVSYVINKRLEGSYDTEASRKTYTVIVSFDNVLSENYGRGVTIFTNMDIAPDGDQGMISESVNEIGLVGTSQVVLDSTVPQFYHIESAE